MSAIHRIVDACRYFGWGCDAMSLLSAGCRLPLGAMLDQLERGGMELGGFLRNHSGYRDIQVPR